MLTKLTIYDLQEVATKRGGKCLSKKYIGNHKKHRWQCSNNHVWEAVPSSIKQGHWCPFCAGKAKLSIALMQILAKNHGGKCLSKKYFNGKQKLKWQCANGHVWEATAHNIKDQGQWCPLCGFQNIMENLCREILQLIFKKSFLKSKPKWLLNKAGNNMELDGYNEELALAFEYHGKQHYAYSKFFHNKNKKMLARRKMDDIRKKFLCTQNGVKLIEIPFTVRIPDLYKYILNRCSEVGVKTPVHTKIDIQELKLNYFAKTMDGLRQLAKKKGGFLVSDVYLGTKAKLKWKCSNGHIWETTPHAIRVGYWCPYCVEKAKLTIEEMQKLAIRHGGECLSKKYTNSKTKLKWQCAEGHIWMATPSDIKNGGYWCPFCAGLAPLTIREMQDLAENQGGKCLSRRYVNSITKLKWQCSKGHVWEAVPSSVKRGHWCPVCAIQKRKFMKITKNQK